MPVTSDFDPKSPTGMVLAYLQSKGLTPSSNNVRSALETQARDPTTIPDLVTEQPPPADQRNPSKTSKSVAGEVEGAGRQALPTPPIPPVGYAPTGTDNGTPTTSAQPTPVGGAPDVGNVGQIITSLMAAGGLGAGGGALLGGLPRPGMPMPGAAVPPPVDPGAGVAAPADQYRVAPGPDLSAPGGDVTDIGNPLEAAMRKAVAPAQGMVPPAPQSQVAPMTPAEGGQPYVGNARPDTSTTLEPAPIPLASRRRVTIEEIPHTPPPRVAPRMRIGG